MHVDHTSNLALLLILFTWYVGFFACCLRFVGIYSRRRIKLTAISLLVVVMVSLLSWPALWVIHLISNDLNNTTMYTIKIIDSTRATLLELHPNSPKFQNYYEGTVPRIFDLHPGYQFEYEVANHQQPPTIGSTINVTGSWLNYYKTIPPLLTLVIMNYQLLQPTPAEATTAA